MGHAAERGAARADVVALAPAEAPEVRQTSGGEMSASRPEVQLDFPQRPRGTRSVDRRKRTVLLAPPRASSRLLAPPRRRHRRTAVTSWSQALRVLPCESSPASAPL